MNADQFYEKWSGRLNASKSEEWNQMKKELRVDLKALLENERQTDTNLSIKTSD